MSLDFIRTTLTPLALAWVPAGLSEVGTVLQADLPDPYAKKPGEPVEAVVSEVPFRPSVNPSAREVAKKRGRDYTD